MTKIILNDKEYVISELPNSVQAQIQAIQFSQAEITRHQMHIAALETAKNAYTQAIAVELENKQDQTNESKLELPENLDFSQ